MRKIVDIANEVLQHEEPNRSRRRAVEQFRRWDESMIRKLGPLYHVRVGYSVH